MLPVSVDTDGRHIAVTGVTSYGGILMFVATARPRHDSSSVGRFVERPRQDMDNGAD